MLAGRTFSLRDDKGAPAVAVVNQEFARKIFGSVTSALGRYYMMRDGTRVQVVGIAEDGKYRPTWPRIHNWQCSSPSCNHPRVIRGWCCGRAGIGSNLTRHRQ